MDANEFVSLQQIHKISICVDELGRPWLLCNSLSSPCGLGFGPIINKTKRLPWQIADGISLDGSKILECHTGYTTLS